MTVTTLAPEIMALEASLQTVMKRVCGFTPFKDIKLKEQQLAFLLSQARREPELAANAKAAAEVIWLRMAIAGYFDPVLVPTRKIEGVDGTYDVPISLCGGAPDGYIYR